MVQNEIFESYAENAFDQETKENSLVWKREWYDANFKQFFPINKDAALLDIGPGLGELLITEKDWGYQNAYAIDISPSTTRYCNERGLHCEHVEDTASWLFAHTEEYDVITLLDVFEHVPQDKTIEFLSACKNALKQNGILILQVPNAQSAESFLHRYNDITHVFGYSQHTLEQLISVVKFETVRFYPFEEYPGEDKKHLRKMREIYWRMLRQNRELTHNLNPEILTPEVFVILSKAKINLPYVEKKREVLDVSIEEIKEYFDRCGISSDIFIIEEQVKNMKNQVERNAEWIKNSEAELQRQIDRNSEWIKNSEAELQRQIDRNTEWLKRIEEEMKGYVKKIFRFSK